MRSAISLLLVILCAPAHADIYRWVDSDGTVHFSDEPRGETDAIERVELPPINSIRSVDVVPAATRSSATRDRSEVVMYSASWCGYCDQARDHFQTNGIAFREYDVETSERGRREYTALDGRGVPLILIGDQRMNGFSAQRFDRLYGR